MADVRMALRDASWFSHPNVGHLPQYHVVVDDYMAACNPRRMPLTEFTECPLTQVRPSHRCQRPGCRKRWKAAEEAT